MSIYKGGYITIDCGGKDILTESGIEIPGVYNAVKETEGKIVILENVTIGNSTFKYYLFDNLVIESTDYAYSTLALVIYIYNTDVIVAESIE